MARQVTYRVVCKRGGMIDFGLPGKWARYVREQHNAGHRAFDQIDGLARVEREEKSTT